MHNAWITLIFADKSGVNCVDKYVDRVDINTAVTLLECNICGLTVWVESYKIMDIIFVVAILINERNRNENKNDIYMQ